jgi:DNA-binding SARP family transcriptional activator/pimeloyl-ACP methyl ester carboxylesterase
VATVAFGLLGPLRVVADGVDITPSAPKERALLAMLLVDPGRIVASDRAIEELWPDLAPDNARRVLQVRVSGLRRHLQDAAGSAVIEFAAPGYRLVPDGVEIDVQRFFDLVRAGREHIAHGAFDVAADALRASLSLWRGEPLADVRVNLGLEAEAARLQEAWLSASETLIDAELGCGRHDAVLSDLERLVAAHPLRERLWGQKVLALYRSGRQADALRACDTIRKRLVEEVGVTPGSALRALEADILAQRPELDWVPAGTGGPSTRLHDGLMPAVRYARAPDDVHIAFQVFGQGPRDIIVVPGCLPHLETWWEAQSGRFARCLAAFGRLILFDLRGTGLSDRPDHFDLQQWADDLTTVLDVAGSERATLIGLGPGGSIATLFAAAHPERVQALVLHSSWARMTWAEDYPQGVPYADVEHYYRVVEATWGRIDQIDPATGRDMGLGVYCPSVATDPVTRELWARMQRISTSPAGAVAYTRVTCELDIRRVLATITVPTLVLHPSRDRAVPVEHGRYLAEHIPTATFVEIDSEDHVIWFSDAVRETASAITSFLTAPDEHQAAIPAQPEQAGEDLNEPMHSARQAADIFAQS